MPFDDSLISHPMVTRAGGDMVVTWQSSAAAGSVYQVYVNGVLAWHGLGPPAIIPFPTSPYGTVNVGTVLPSEAALDLSSELPSGPPRRVSLQWYGGTYLDPDVQGFHVYQGTAAGGPVDYSHVADTVAAYLGGFITDGYGQGPYGYGGYGEDATLYSWTSGLLSSGGEWSFGVKSFDGAGNEGPALTWTVDVVAPPHPPGPNPTPGGPRVLGVYDPTAHTITLTWFQPLP
jgi:hypothetical protein